MPCCGPNLEPRNCTLNLRVDPVQAYKDLRSTSDLQVDMWDRKGRRHYVRLGSVTFSCSHIQVIASLGWHAHM